MESEESVRRQGGGGGSSQSLHRAATFTMFNFLLLVSVCLSSTTREYFIFNVCLKIYTYSGYRQDLRVVVLYTDRYYSRTIISV